jgi:anti-sigma regulatory factor (Ser/Thr protein kinase)
VPAPFTWSLAHDLTAPGHARALVGELCEARHPELGSDAWDVALLLLTELVTNAVRYGEGPVDLALVEDPTLFRVDVADQGHAMPVMDPTADLLSDRGRGLLLVESLARAWGVTPVPDVGKRVWFELPPLTSP